MDLKLTTRSQEAMTSAIQRAATDGAPQVEPAHLLAALLAQGDGVAPALLQAIGVDLAALRRSTEAALAALPTASGQSVSSPNLARSTFQAMSGAGDVARELGDEYVSTEHLLIGLASASSSVSSALAAVGATKAKLLEALPGVRGNGKVTSADPEGTYKSLEKYG